MVQGACAFKCHAAVRSKGDTVAERGFGQSNSSFGGANNLPRLACMFVPLREGSVPSVFVQKKYSLWKLDNAGTRLSTVNTGQALSRKRDLGGLGWSGLGCTTKKIAPAALKPRHMSVPGNTAARPTKRTKKEQRQKLATLQTRKWSSDNSPIFTCDSILGPSFTLSTNGTHKPRRA